MKPLKTAAAEPVCGQNLQLLGLMDARRAADADRRAVCGQRVPGSAPDLLAKLLTLNEVRTTQKVYITIARCVLSHFVTASVQIL